MKKIVSAILAGSFALASCSQAPEEEHHHDSHIGGPTSSVPASERTPYPDRWIYLDSAGPEEVALAVVDVVATATATQNSESIVADLNGVLSVQGLSEIGNQSWKIMPEITGPLTQTWLDAGGHATAETTISAETHPEDTSTTWVRKIDSIRTLDGIDSPVHDSWMIALSRRHDMDNWRLDNLVHTTTSFNDQPSTPASEEDPHEF